MRVRVRAPARVAGRVGALLAAAVILVLPQSLAGQAQRLQHSRPFDREGINVFEPPKEAGVPFDGLAIEWGAAFTQQLQALDHRNSASPDIVSGVDLNGLMDIGAGFNLATANLYFGAQLDEGIQVHLTTYLSSRHHPETWVKDGYLLVDAVPFLNSERLDRLMEYVTLRLGHFEINYGDAHFRRTDNGNAMYNPFVGNSILESFTTEIGGELYVRTPGGLVAMLALTGGEIRGAVERPDERSPSIYGKLGFDRNLSQDLRIRLTGSFYATASSISNTLYGGDRAGSRYYLVLENPNASTSSQFTSGRLNPGFGDEVTAFMVNPFVKAGPLEFFGIAERAEGRSSAESSNREWSHYSGDAVFRFLSDDEAYVGARYSVATGALEGIATDVRVDRIQVGGGWFLGSHLLVKAEYVRQTYDDFPSTDIRSGGRFDGVVMEGVVAF